MLKERQAQDSPHFASHLAPICADSLPDAGVFLHGWAVWRWGAAGLRDGGRLKDIHAFIDGLYGHDLHAKRVASLAAATFGVMAGASLAVAMIGQALAQARGLVTKHAINRNGSVAKLAMVSGVGMIGL